MKQCAECRDGEHDNLTDDVRLVVIRDPDTKKLVKRAYLCSDHLECYAMDGYEIIEKSKEGK